MGLIRRILVAVIAVSVAVLSASSETIVSPSPVEMTMIDQADMPCCPYCNTQGDFKATACVLKCVAPASAILPATIVSLLFLDEGRQFSSVEDTLHGLVRAPPTHPPSA